MNVFIVSPEEMFYHCARLCFSYDSRHILKYDADENAVIIDDDNCIYECDYEAFIEYCLTHELNLTLTCI